MPSADLSLTTADRVWAYLDLASEDARTIGRDAMQGMIGGVSNSIANLCNTDFAVKARTERRQLMLPDFKLSDGPARSITSVRYSERRTFATGSVTLAPSAYELSPDGLTLYIGDSFAQGLNWEVAYIGGSFYTTNSSQYEGTATGLVVLQQHIQPDGRKLTLTAWDGALVTFSADAGRFRTGETIALSGGASMVFGECVKESVCNDGPDLEQACLMQVSNLWQRHKTLGRTATDTGNGSTQFVKDYDLLPGVRTLLTRYSRPFTFI